MIPGFDLCPTIPHSGTLYRVMPAIARSSATAGSTAGTQPTAEAHVSHEFLKNCESEV
jgi:hypothetical protein